MTTSTNINGSSHGLTAEHTNTAFALPVGTSANGGKPQRLQSDPAENSSDAKPWKTRWVATFGIVFVVGLVGTFAAATSPRIYDKQALAAAAADQSTARPRLTAVTVRRGAADSDRELPGNAQAFLMAAIYGRTNGYLKRRLVDIGDHVKAGQLLAEIASPEVDAQLEQSKATLLQSKANLVKLQADEVFARAEEGRYRPLLSRGAATQEAYDQKLAIWKMDLAAISAMEATIKMNEADIQRLTALQSFETLTAPFAGVVTTRNVDPGDLITADNPSTERLLFRVAQIDPLRVFVDVPQVFSTDVQVGQTAVLYRREDPSKQYTGKMTRTAYALDPNSRTLRTEIDVPNPQGALLPGMCLQVKFIFDRKTVPMMIPTAAVIVRTGFPKVAVLDGHDAVHYRGVKLGRDYGTEVEALTGLHVGERVIVYPGDDLPEGTVVEPISSRVE
jgi:RND family efflux transporter MFP subunit